MDYILFSPVGTTDPITDFRDGSMIHICRKYRPSRVYLYLSKEMLALHQLDNRYCRCLEWLQEKENFTCEVEVLARPDLVDVHLFDRFYDEFEEIAQKITLDYPESTILFNVASGTPAMKFALQFLAATSENMYLPIQVTSPENGANRAHRDFEKYDGEISWELNKDNEEGFQDRCIQSETAILNKRIKIEIICKHIQAYDYQAAWRVAQTIEKLLPKNIMLRLEGAAKRHMLDFSGGVKAFDQAGVTVFPAISSDWRLVIEYLLWLQSKQQRGDLVDFIRGLTPVFVDLFLLALESKCKMDFKTYCTRDKKGVLRINRQKLGKNPELLNFLDGKFKNGLQDGPLGSAVLVYVLEKECTDTQVVKLALELRHIEEEGRNPVAHAIVSVSEDWLKKMVDYSSHQIMGLLKTFTQLTCPGLKKNIWQSYDQMNEEMIKALTSQQ